MSRKSEKKQKPKKSEKSQKQQQSAANLSSNADAMQPLKTVQSKSSGSLIEHAPVYSPDSKYLVTAFAQFLRVFSVQTGNCVRTITIDSGKNEDARIVSISMNPKNPFQLYAMLSDGRLTLWDFVDGALLKSFNTGFNDVLSMQPDPNHSQAVFVATSSTSATEQRARIYHINLETNNKEKILKMTGINAKEMQFRLHPNKPMLAAIFEKEVALCYWDAQDILESTTVRFTHDRKIKALCFHPTEMVLATADMRGQINLWHYEELLRGQRDAVKRPGFVKLHWHSQSVNSMQFTQDGHYLISGGDEAVLVVWQLETGHKDFLPRLRAPIAHVAVSPDQMQFALSLHDNCIRLVSVIDMKIQRSIVGLKAFGCWEKPVEPFKCPDGGQLLREPRNGYLVMNGAPGCLQFWNTETNQHVLDVEVAPRPRVYKNDSGVVPASVIQHVAFSADGLWMATVDRLETKAVDARLDSLKRVAETFLKFWKWNVDANAFELITRIDEPHSGKINRLTFHPQGIPFVYETGTVEYLPMCVTASADESFKLWQLSVPKTALPSIAQRKSKQQKQNQQHRQELIQTWYCRSTGVWRPLPATDAIFSRDGSMLCVAYENLITLWNPFTLQFHGVLSNQSSGNIKQLLFAQSSKALKSRDHLLIVHFEHGLCVWNCIDGKQVWQLPGLDVRHMLVAHGLLCVVANNNQCENQSKSIILLFDVIHARPVLKMTVDDNIAAIQAISNGRLIYMSRDKKALITLYPSDDSIKNADSEEPAQPADTINNRGFFSSIYGTQWKSAGSDSRKNAPSAVLTRPVTVDSAAFSVLEAPSHVLPPVGKFFKSFMRTMLRPKPTPPTDMDHSQTSMSTVTSISSSSSEDDSAAEAAVFGGSVAAPTAAEAINAESLAQLLADSCDIDNSTKQYNDWSWMSGVVKTSPSNQ